MRRSHVTARPILAFAAIVWMLGASVPRAEVSWSQEVRARVFKLLTEGIKAYKEGRPKEAIPLLSDAADVALNSFTAYYYLGLALKADRQYERAIEPLQIAIELEPVNLQARVALADCYLKHGEPAEALAEYHRVIARQADYAPAWDGLGRAAESGGDDEEAVKNYRKAIDLNPGFPDAALNLGDLLLRHGRHTEAIDLFLKAIKVRPDFAAAYNRLGVAYADQRLYNEAIAALRQAESLEKGNPWHPVTIGGIFMQLDSLVEAGRELEAALALDPDYLEGYLGKSSLQRRRGDLEGAVTTLDAGLARVVEDERTMAMLRERRAQIVAENARMN
ncbi:MAG TPA: tetratricopeptide repeat protein, partial [Candidatus Polarisedimenticolia bacterium]|nr:tetratricopeptide repeat protein [Candidatus Polarisedimenticolia bacterium]